MNISLEEAIEIHAKVLKSQHKHRAPQRAREHAQRLKMINDHDGHEVWSRVAAAAERMLSEEKREFCDEP
jgi:hypothetical protein